ncbi:MAG TPA: hypothetical protein VLB09_09540, partial [Nitrospiria bacterium]|nr:hypothetical protein [Nitrospiria bacterium]
MIYLTVLFVIITARFEGKRWRLPSKVYTNSFILYPGLNIREIKLMDRLKHLGYTQSGGTPARPGTFHPSSSVLELYLNEFKYPDHQSPSIRVDIRLEENRITEIEHSETGESLPLLELEPELIDAFYDQTWEERELVR